MNEYVADGHHGDTPDELLREADLNDSRREQVKQYLAVTRYTMFKNDENMTPTASGHRPLGPMLLTGTFERPLGSVP